MRLGLVLFLLSTGCASSKWTRSFLNQEIEKASGHQVRDSLPQASPLPPHVAGVKDLTEDQVVAIALWNSPRFHAELERLGFARADLDEAGAIANIAFSFLFPIGPRQLEASALFPIAAWIQSPLRVAAAQADLERIARSLVAVGLDLKRDVRLAYGDLDVALRRRIIQTDLEQSWRQLLRLTEARLQSGDASEFDARSVRAELAIATDARRRSAQDAEVATVRLLRLLGLSESTLALEVSLRAAEVPSTVACDLEKRALAMRPEIRAAEMAIEAAGARQGLERSRIFQFLGRLDSKPPGLFVPGFQVEVPLNSNPGGRGRADSEMAQAALRYVAQREDVLAEVRVARLQWQQAKQSLALFRSEVLPPLEANVQSITRAFEVGGETQLVVLEALRRLQEAKLREASLLGDAWRAAAVLERAVGGKIE